MKGIIVIASSIVPLFSESLSVMLLQCENQYIRCGYVQTLFSCQPTITALEACRSGLTCPNCRMFDTAKNVIVFQCSLCRWMLLPNLVYRAEHTTCCTEFIPEVFVWPDLVMSELWGIVLSYQIIQNWTEYCSPRMLIETRNCSWNACNIV